MRKYINSQASQHEMKLKQMGANVKLINSKMCYVSFDIEGIEISYVYNINNKNKFFLERIKPYPIITKEFDNEEDVIKVIEIDVHQFQNATKSKNIKQFIEINKQLNYAKKEFEDLFLYYNVPTEEVSIIIQKISEIHDEIIKTKMNSERVFFEKDPDNI